MVRELDGLERLMYCCLCLPVCGGPGRLSDGTGAGRSGAADVLLSLSVSVRRTRTSVGWYGSWTVWSG